MKNKMMLGERYRLEIHWSKVVYDQDGLAKLEGCYLGGPVLKEVNQMSQKDFMDLDFGNQYSVFIKQYYIARFSWDGVRQTPEKIMLNNVILKNKHVNSVPKLNNNDYIIIDTKDHVDDKHTYYLTYPSYLIRFDGDRYNFVELGR